MSQDRRKKGLLLLERISQDLDTRTSQELPTRACIQAPLRHGICKLPMQGLLGDLLRRTCTGLCNDLLQRNVAGSAQPLRARIYSENGADPELENLTAQTLCEPAQSKCTWTSHKSHFMREFAGQMPCLKNGTRVLCEPAQSKRTFMDMSQEPAYARIYKNLTRVLCKRTWACHKSIQEPFYARIFKINAVPQKLAARFLRLACAVEMHLDISQEQFHAKIYTKKAAPQSRGADFVQACAVGNALGHLIRAISCENFRKNAGDQSAHPDLTPASNSYRKNPSVWTHCLGNQSSWNKCWHAGWFGSDFAEAASEREGALWHNGLHAATLGGFGMLGT